MDRVNTLLNDYEKFLYFFSSLMEKETAVSPVTLHNLFTIDKSY